LLLQSQFLTSVSVIVGVEYGSDGLSFLSFLNSTLIVRRIELVEIEVLSRARTPESQVVGVIGIETRNRSIVSHGNNFVAALPFSTFGITILVFLAVSVESDLISNILTLNFPRISIS
jgi:hypothetical protein